MKALTESETVFENRFQMLSWTKASPLVKKRLLGYLLNFILTCPIVSNVMNWQLKNKNYKKPLNPQNTQLFKIFTVR